MFKPKLFDIDKEHARVYGVYERIYTLIDLSAALFFLVGSILFFYPELVYTGTWMFVAGSALFTARPAVRFLREYHLAQLPLPGDEDPSRE